MFHVGLYSLIAMVTAGAPAIPGNGSKGAAHPFGGDDACGVLQVIHEDVISLKNKSGRKAGFPPTLISVCPD